MALFIAPLSGQTVVASSYYRACQSGIGCYKMEAIRQMITPQMRRDAIAWSNDPRLRELVAMAGALDALMFDGVRLVKERGLLVDTDAIDEFAVCRTVFFFKVNPQQARAWLLASRLIQMEKTRDEVNALALMEVEMSDTAADLALRLRTYFGDKNAMALMPHFAWQWANFPRTAALADGRQGNGV